MEPQATILLAKVYVLNPDGQILTIRRSKTDPRKPLTWDLPGGFLNPGEDPTVAAIRETKEEVGIEIRDPRVFHVESFNDTKYGIRLFYYANVSNVSITLSYEHDEFKWVTKEEFAELDTPDVFKQITKLLPI
jgi:ADP-ribose pyrophosphatase YjhB (NUDIX family)